MHTRQTLLEARLATVRRDLHEVMDRLTPEMLGWAPASGMRTISGQLVEIVATEMQLTTLLREDRFIDDPTAAAIIGDLDDLDNLRRATESVRADTLAYLASLSEADLADEVEFQGGWFGSLGLPTIPRAEVFVSIADHEWYHVGQLTSYLWARGIDPYQ
jgi:uncharacterized damage-inducible protein DinB